MSAAARRSGTSGSRMNKDAWSVSRDSRCRSSRGRLRRWPAVRRRDCPDPRCGHGRRAVGCRLWLQGPAHASGETGRSDYPARAGGREAAGARNPATRSRAAGSGDAHWWLRWVRPRPLCWSMARRTCTGPSMHCRRSRTPGASRPGRCSAYSTCWQSCRRNSSRRSSRSFSTRRAAPSATTFSRSTRRTGRRCRTTSRRRPAR